MQTKPTKFRATALPTTTPQFPDPKARPDSAWGKASLATQERLPRVTKKVSLNTNGVVPTSLRPSLGKCNRNHPHPAPLPAQPPLPNSQTQRRAPPPPEPKRRSSHPTTTEPIELAWPETMAHPPSSPSLPFTMAERVGERWFQPSSTPANTYGPVSGVLSLLACYHRHRLRWEHGRSETRPLAALPWSCKPNQNCRRSRSHCACEHSVPA